MPIEEQVVVIYAGTNGFVDDYPVAVLGRYEKELLSFMKSRKQDILDEIKSTGDLKDDQVDVTGADGKVEMDKDGKPKKKKVMGGLEKRLRDAFVEFAKQFSVEEKKK
jgi:hypothetical protein